MRSKSLGVLCATALTATACHTMKPLTWSEVEGMRPSRVWVTQEDRTIVEVSGPQLFGDTLVGYVAGEFRELPTSSVQQVTMRRPARGKTIALIAASTGVAVGIGVWISGIGDPLPRQFLDCADTPDDPECQN